MILDTGGCAIHSAFSAGFLSLWRSGTIAVSVQFSILSYGVVEHWKLEMRKWKPQINAALPFPY